MSETEPRKDILIDEILSITLRLEQLSKDANRVLMILKAIKELEREIES